MSCVEEPVETNEQSNYTSNKKALLSGVDGLVKNPLSGEFVRNPS